MLSLELLSHGLELLSYLGLRQLSHLQGFVLGLELLSQCLELLSLFLPLPGPQILHPLLWLLSSPGMISLLGLLLLGLLSLLGLLPLLGLRLLSSLGVILPLLPLPGLPPLLELLSLLRLPCLGGHPSWLAP